MLIYAPVTYVLYTFEEKIRGGTYIHTIKINICIYIHIKRGRGTKENYVHIGSDLSLHQNTGYKIKSGL